MEEESSELTDENLQTMETVESEESELERMNTQQGIGETTKDYRERMEKMKEVDRVQKLMKFAFPRQRETHIYKRKLLSPQELKMNLTVSLVHLKKEQIRVEQENYDKLAAEATAAV